MKKERIAELINRLERLEENLKEILWFIRKYGFD